MNTKIFLMLALLSLLVHAGDEQAGLRLDHKIVEKSMNLGRSYLLINQTKPGNFIYSYNLETREQSVDDNPVRQAGARWALALLHRDQPSLLTQTAVRNGLAFWAANSNHIANRGRYPVYPGKPFGSTGTVALLVLTHIELLSAKGGLSDIEQGLYRDYLNQYGRFLLFQRRESGHFSRYYSHEDGDPVGEASPYADGEALFALVKVARYMRNDELRDLAMKSAAAMHQRHVVDARKEHPDSDDTKAYFQWGIMAYFEMVDAGWPETEVYAKRAIEMAEWMIDTHRVLQRNGNTAYAFEGIILARELARRQGDHPQAAALTRVIDQGLHHLTTWQIAGPLESECPYLAREKPRDPLVIGGVLSGPEEPWLRIDITQHQVHALILARRYIYK